MDSIYLPIVVDSSYQPLSIEKQLAIAFVKSVPRNSRIKKATLIGWPLLAVKNENSGGYVIFDETLTIETKLQFIILQDFKKVLDNLENNKNDSEILAILKSYRWSEIRGKEEEIYKGILTDDITSLLSYGSPELPLKILDKSITQFDVDSAFNNLSSREHSVLENIKTIDDVESKVTTLLTIIKGKRAEERKQIEDKYNSLIQQKNELLKNTLANSKKNLENDISSEANKLYSKLANIEVLIGKAELDYEANPSLQKDLENLITLRTKYLNEIQSKLAEIKNKYRVEIRNIVREIESLNAQKQSELNQIDTKIKELDQLQKSIISQLENLKSTCQSELERIKSFTKRAPFDKEKVEVILPFLISVDINNAIIIVSTLIYNSTKKSSFFGFFKRDPSEIADSMKVNLNTFYSTIASKYANLEDNLRNTNAKSTIEKGLEELYNEGWGVRRTLAEYYF